MPHSLPPLPVPAWNTQATYSSIYTPGIHAIDPHSSIAMSIHNHQVAVLAAHHLLDGFA